MNPRLHEFGLKKQRLQLQAASQRLELAQHLQAFSPALALVDRVGAGAHWLKAHPQWLIGAAVIVLVVRPRAALRWLLRGFVAWRGLRRARQALDSLILAL